MSIEVTEQSILSLAEYARIPIAFQVNRILDVACPPHEGGAFVLTERDAHPAVVKDYDAGQNGPLTWTRRFDLSNWAMFSARFDGRRAGGAVVVYRSPDIEML